MKIEFSEHAGSRLKGRPQITKEMVEKAIKFPDSIKISYRGRNIFRKRFGDNLVEVVTTAEDDKIIVITQYLLGEA